MYSLGRKKEHDEQSKNYAIRKLVTIPRPEKVAHRHSGKVLDQGELGGCTGFSMAQLLNTAPFHKMRMPLYRESDARELYMWATFLDEWKDVNYPPIDCGSSGLGVAKAAKKLKYISTYHHSFSMEEALDGLSLGPGITGTNWYTDMFEPDKNGFVKPTGKLEGGHEYLVLGYDTKKGIVVFLNSWGPEWGKKGVFYMLIEDFDKLLHEEGDVTFPQPLTV